MKWPWEGASPVIVRFFRQVSEGSWILLGSLTVLENGTTHCDFKVDERIVSEVLLSLYRDNVAFGTSDLDGVNYRWEETSNQEQWRYLYQ